LLASHNAHKIKELKQLLKDVNVDIVTLADLSDTEEVNESGSSFKENALIKARHYYQKYQMPVLADDSGLCVNALSGGPGVHSKRFSSGNDYDHNIKLINLLRQAKDRHAAFVTVIVFYLNDDEIRHFEGLVEGTISQMVVSQEGFGYDPVFIPNGYAKTFYELGSDVKNQMSHRALALKQVLEYLYENLNYK